jgi:hypothetical protein
MHLLVEELLFPLVLLLSSSDIAVIGENALELLRRNANLLCELVARVKLLHEPATNTNQIDI